MASLMQGDPGASFVEAKQYDQRLSTLPNSEAAKTLLQNEVPETWAALLSRYSSDSNSISTKPSGLSLAGQGPIDLLVYNRLQGIEQNILDTRIQQTGFPSW